MSIMPVLAGMTFFDFTGDRARCSEKATISADAANRRKVCLYQDLRLAARANVAFFPQRGIFDPCQWIFGSQLITMSYGVFVSGGSAAGTGNANLREQTLRHPEKSP